LTSDKPFEVTCISQGNYIEALTRGKHYLVLDRDDAKEQIRVRGDNQRHRWFSSHLFDFENRPLLTMVSYTVDDKIENRSHAWVEVTITFNTGEHRWCSFTTPLALAEYGNFIPNTTIRFHYGLSHVIIANELSVELIGDMLKHVEAQNELMRCTLPLKPSNDDDSEGA
jgi:hypothetical protein